MKINEIKNIINILDSRIEINSKNIQNNYINIKTINNELILNIIFSIL